MPGRLATTAILAGVLEAGKRIETGGWRMRLTAHIKSARDGWLSLKIEEIPALVVHARTVTEIPEAVRSAVRHKELKHRISDPGFVRASRSMSQIGG